MIPAMILLVFVAAAACAAPETSETEPSTSGPATRIVGAEKADGFNGIWYANQPQEDEYKYKYSGGFATYPQQHIPIAVYAKEANKTFFVYGGAKPGTRELLHMISYYDHVTSTVARPTF